MVYFSGQVILEEQQQVLVLVQVVDHQTVLAVFVVVQLLRSLPYFVQVLPLQLKKRYLKLTP